MKSRRHVQEAWHAVSIRRRGLSVACNLNPAPDAGSATLCIIAAQAGNVEDPVGLEREPDVVSQWVDRLTAAGTSVLLVHGECFDDLWRLAEDLRSERDVFALWLERMGMVVDHSVAHDYGDPGRLVAMGVSRYGFAVLQAMANFPGIAASVAHQPVVWWPRLEEFQGMENNPIVLANSLFEFAGRLPPRPVLVQTGYNDQRLGQGWTELAVRRISDVYRADGSGDRFTHDLMDIPGHDDTPIPASAPDSVVAWMREQQLIQDRCEGGGQDRSTSRQEELDGPSSHRTHRRRWGGPDPPPARARRHSRS